MDERIRILGLDPGLRHTGWAVIDAQGGHLSFVAAGVANSTQTLPLARRLTELYNQINDVIASFSPDEAAVEETAAMAVTPNPNHGRFSLEIPFEGEWQVFDMEGRLVMKRYLAEGVHSMDVALPSGHYLMVLVSGTRQATGKLVVL